MFVMFKPYLAAYCLGFPHPLELCMYSILRPIWTLLPTSDISVLRLPYIKFTVALLFILVPRLRPKSLLTVT